MDIDTLIASIRSDLPGFLPASVDSLPLFRPIDIHYANKEDLFDSIEEAAQSNAIESHLEHCLLLLSKCVKNREEKRKIESELISFWLGYRNDKNEYETAAELKELGSLDFEASIAKKQYESLNNTKTLFEEVKQVSDQYLDRYKAGSEPHQNRLDFISRHARNMAISGDAAAETSKNVELMKMEWEKYSAQLTNLNLETQIEDAASKAVTAKFKSEYYLARKEPLGKRIQNTKESLELRQYISTLNGTALNYPQRLSEIQRLFDIDFVNLISRTKSLHTGFNSIYKINHPLPSIENKSVLTEISLWIRQAIEIHNKVKLSSQAFGWTVSLKELLAADDWADGLDNKVFTFSLENLLFEYFDRLRLQSLRVFFISNKLSLANSCVLEKVGDDTSIIIAISNMSNFNYASPYGTNSSAKYQNMSPFGEWRLKFAKLTDTEITDILIEMTVEGDIDG